MCSVLGSVSLYNHNICNYIQNKNTKNPVSFAFFYNFWRHYMVDKAGVGEKLIGQKWLRNETNIISFIFDNSAHLFVWQRQLPSKVQIWCHIYILIIGRAAWQKWYVYQLDWCNEDHEYLNTPLCVKITHEK